MREKLKPIEIQVLDGYDSFQVAPEEPVVLGAYNTDEKKIYVAGELPQEVFVKILMHELFHWIQDVAGTEFDEDDAHKFAENIWGAFCKRNDDADVVTFKVIDTKTGEEPTAAVIQNLAKAGGLLLHDIDEFYLSESGQLCLSDDTGRMTGCNPDRFKVVVESEATE